VVLALYHGKLKHWCIIH